MTLTATQTAATAPAEFDHTGQGGKRHVTIYEDPNHDDCWDVEDSAGEHDPTTVGEMRAMQEAEGMADDIEEETGVRPAIVTL